MRGGSELLTCLLGVTEHADDGMRLIQGSCGLPSNLLGFLLDKRSLIPQFGGQRLPRLMWVRRIGKLDERPCLALQGTGVQGDEGQGMSERVVGFGCDGVGQLLIGEIAMQAHRIIADGLGLGSGLVQLHS